MLRRVSFGALAAVLMLGAACGDDDDDITPPPVQNNFTATLTGDAERPDPVTTSASGTATITIDEATSTISFTITVANITDVIAAHIHVGGVDQVGPPSVDLLPEAAPAGTINGTLSSGVAGALDVGGGETFASLVSKIRSGNAYVNVHTVLNPDGEIRGQLTPN